MDKKEYHFQKLTPINNSDLNIYEDALNFVFANDDLKNIAISGPYSSGKSSLIETYKSEYTDKKFLHISLAHFESPESTDIPTYDEVVLEGKILNQLIHQIDPNKIPKTNFKVKQNVSDKGTIKSTLFISLFLILIAYIVFFNSWSNYVSSMEIEWVKNILMWTTVSELLLVSGILCSIIFGITIYSIITTQKNKNIFKRLNLQGNEIEIFQETNESYFDKYLNEVLYIFENSDVDVIIFEDIDRYNVNQIFEKLREINTLINNKKSKDEKTPIRFIYLLRDDIFISKDRTKFFDFIIPVVPVIDSSNSHDKFIEHFVEGEIIELFDEVFLKGLSLYIDDMRILKNIYNEFIIYNNLVQSIELNKNRLLAIITYKNIFPRDFSDLQLSMGYVHTLFESKTELLKEEFESINHQIKEVEEKLDLSNVEKLESINELDAVYLLSNYRINNASGIDISNFKTRADLVKAIKENPDSVQIQENYSSRLISLQPDLEELLQNPEYIKRKEAIERNVDNQIEELKSELQTLQKQRTIIQNSRLRSIITKDNIDNIFSVNFINQIGVKNDYKEIKGSPYFPLIKYLIRNGYIDETYPDYMTYFYENSLNRIDKNFLLSITDQMPKDYSYSLINPKVVLSRLQLIDFEQIEILNFDLLCHLLNTRNINEKYFISFLEQLKRTKNFKFITEFLETQRETVLFIEALNKIWPRIFDDIFSVSNLSYEQKKQYVIHTLYNSSVDDILALNDRNSLTKFISESPNFLDIINPNIDVLIDGFTKIGVKFEWIDYEVSNKELFAAVYKNNLYLITFELIELFLIKVYGLNKSNDFYNKNYTLISSKEDEPLLQYVNRNMNEYMRVNLENSNEDITDEESATLTILNHVNIKPDYKIKYIGYLQTKLDNIEKVINAELWKYLLQEKLVNYTEINILNYFFKNGNVIDTYLIEFINSSSINFRLNTNSSIYTPFGEKSKSDFVKAVVLCNELSNERYESILKTSNTNFNSFLYSDIEYEKFSILIKLNIIIMTESNLLFIREIYPENLMHFITHNFSEYIKIINSENYVFDEMISVLDENVDEPNKIKLLEFTTEKLTIKQKGYSDLVKQHILKDNFDVADIEFLLSDYSNESVAVKKIICDISIRYVRHIIDNQYSIDFKLLSDLLSSNVLEMDVKKELFLMSLPNLNETQARENLTTLQMSEFLGLFERKRPRIEVNEINTRILKIFKEKNWITKFEIDNEDTEFYRAYGRKVNEDELM
ncbi:hypothetical protein ACFVR1_16470 [Psychrobacillus sp. NPDC058041]|uniref:YobI family P-loop NTPase n=1 Tax=Psychrobacillus sp. NPDC058041 TaxID=3346310 RepID=UPI0036DDEE25